MESILCMKREEASALPQAEGIQVIADLIREKTDENSIDKKEIHHVSISKCIPKSCLKTPVYVLSVLFRRQNYKFYDAYVVQHKMFDDYTDKTAPKPRPECTKGSDCTVLLVNLNKEPAYLHHTSK